MEGPDGAGKTTLVQNLLNSLDIELASRACTSEGGPVPQLWKWTTQNLNERLRNPHAIKLYDRYPLISDPIYGPLIRGKLSDGFDTNWFTDAWRVFLELQPVVIFCLPSIESVVKNVSQEDVGQMDGVVFNIRAIYWLYFNLYTRMQANREIPSLRWNYEEGLTSDFKYHEMVDFLQLYIERRIP